MHIRIPQPRLFTTEILNVWRLLFLLKRMRTHFVVWALCCRLHLCSFIRHFKRARQKIEKRKIRLYIYTENYVREEKKFTKGKWIINCIYDRSRFFFFQCWLEQFYDHFLEAIAFWKKDNHGVDAMNSCRNDKISKVETEIISRSKKDLFAFWF